MMEYIPYIVTVICAFISGFASYFAARRQAKADLEKLEKQHALDIEKEREKFAMEKEMLKLEHAHQMELKNKEMENQLGTDVISTFLKAYLDSPAGQALLRSQKGKKAPIRR